MGKVTGILFDSGLRVGPEPPATVLYDKSRYRINGDFRSDGHPDWVELPNGLWAMDFDPGTPDYVTIPASYTQLDFTHEAFSIIARIRLDTLTTYSKIFCRGLINADGYYLGLSTAGSLSLTTSQAAAYQNSKSDDGEILTDAMYTLGCSREGTSAKVFKNGVDVTTTSGTHQDPTTSARAAKIGVYDDNSLPIDGKIVFFRIYKYALSAGQHRNKHTELSESV